MFSHIFAPIDLAHLDQLDRALKVTADAAKHYGAKVTYASVAAAAPGAVAHNPAEFKERLEAFARQQSEAHGIETHGHPIISHDPTIDKDNALLHAIEQAGADLIVMASHKPGFAEYFWPSHGGKIASHSGASVLLVRDA